MRVKIENRVLITCEGVDLTTLTDIEVYIRQGYLFFQYTPEVHSASEMVVTMPFDDAKQLRPFPVRVQFAFTDETGRPDASDIVTIGVEDLLKEDGYGTH